MQWILLVKMTSIPYNSTVAGKKHFKFSDQIRKAVDGSGESRYAICKAIAIDQGQLSRFMAGKMGLSMVKLDALANYLGLDIVVRSKRK